MQVGTDQNIDVIRIQSDFLAPSRYPDSLSSSSHGISQSIQGRAPWIHHDVSVRAFYDVNDDRGIQFHADIYSVS